VQVLPLQLCEKILLALLCCPVSLSFQKGPGVNLVTIKERLGQQQNGCYKTVEEFLDDVGLIFNNCFFSNDVSVVSLKIWLKLTR